MRYIILVFILLKSISSACQEYSWQAEVEPSPIDGYHEILLDPEITGKLRPDYPDLRLLDTDGQQVAYILRHEKATSQWSNFVSYPIISKDYQSDWGWDDKYIVHNPDGNTIDHIVLKVANFVDTRHVNLSGSMDNKQWFVIQDGYTFHNIVSTENDFQFKVVSFPKSSYQYYKIEVDNYHYYNDDPINILDAGYFVGETVSGMYGEVPHAPITQWEDTEQQTSVVNLDIPDGNYLDKIALDMEGANLYHRKVELYNKAPETDTTYKLEKVKEFWISSTHLNEIQLNKLHSYGLKLIVYNYDDKELVFNKINLFQLNTYMVAELTPNTNYVLALGNDSIAAPKYDLRYFERDIPEELPTGSVVNLKALPLQVAEPEKEEAHEKPFYEQSYFIWIAIAAVALILGYMSTRMLTEMKANE